MKRLVSLCLCSVAVQAAVAATYTEVEFEKLKLAPKSYYGKKIAYISTFYEVLTGFLPYMQKSGYNTDKYLMFLIGDRTLPVLARKNDAMISLAAELESGSEVKVSGQLKKFREGPRFTAFPHYFVLLADLEVLRKGDEEPPDGAPRRPIKPPLPGRRPRPGKRLW
jgi:hypothetical protein